MVFFEQSGYSDVAKQPKGVVIAKTASSSLIAENRERIAAYITVNGEKTVWLALGKTAAVGEGIMLAAKTGATVIDGYTGQISCITESGESSVSFSEL